MPKMRGFLKTKEKIDAKDWELAQIRTAARLGDLFRSDDAASTKDAATASTEPETPAAAIEVPIDVGPTPWAGGARPPIIVVGVSEIVSVLGERKETERAVPLTAPAPTEDPAAPRAAEPEVVSPANPIGQTESDVPVLAPAHDARPIGVMARPGDDVGRDPWRLPSETGPTRAFEPPTAAHLFPSPSSPSPRLSEGAHVERPAAVVLGSVAVAEAASVAFEAVPPPVVEPSVATLGGRPPVPVFDAELAATARTPRPVEDTDVGSRPTTTRTRTRRAESPSAPTTTPIAKPAAPRTMSRTARTRTRRAPVPVPVAAYCPYCATRLEPPPTTSKRCDRCRQRIVVKRINGAAVFLTEAAVLVFDAQRERVRNSARWVRDRDRWLGFAAAAGAPAERVRQVGSARVSVDVVAAARRLYVTTVDKAFRAARNARDWDAAARLRREEAGVLHRIAGASVPPTAEFVTIYREGVAAELKGIAEIARDAELVSARCCDACRGDDKAIARISTELRTPRLPHAGCPKGLCRCRWDLATRDRQTLRRYLRRRPGSEPRIGQPAGQPGE
jgi:hypothetical protein